jgi:hypothetical protein
MNENTGHPVTTEQLAPYEVAMQSYRELVDAIAARLTAGDHRSSIPGYIASGDEKHAFRIETSKGPLVAKFLHNNGVTLILRSDLDGTPEDTRTRTIENAAPIMVGEGGEGLEQLKAIDLEQGIMVTTFEPGDRTPELSLWAPLRITRAHLQKLARTLQIMRERGLHPHNAGGILWDPKEGFTIVDYEFADTVKYNKGSIETMEKFLQYALRDFKKFDTLERARLAGVPVAPEAFRTTGIRAMLQRRVIRLAKRLGLQ